MADDYSTRGPSPRAKLAWLVVAACAAALLARLGVWQLDRAHQKIAAAERIAARAMLPPLEPQALAREGAQAEPQWQRRIALRGRWLPAHTVWLANRTMDDRAGFFVETPLELAAGDAVLVQRGWAPRDASDMSKLPPVATPTGEVVVQGRVAPWPSHWLELGSGGSASGPAGPIRQNLDRTGLQAETGVSLRPVVVVEDASEANASDGLVRHWAAPAADVDRNYGYAAQWFAMSAASLVLYAWLALVRPRLKRSRHDHEPAES
jgi:surfeit locus 1 family protein